jgi:hypothetical protein
MNDRERIEQERRNRFKFLKQLYDEKQQLPSGRMQSTPAHEVGQAVGLSADEAIKISGYLKDKGLLKYTAMGPKVGITHSGVEEVEAALADPEHPTSFFPPINVLNIHGDVHGSQIQQGTKDSSQHQTISSEDRLLLTSSIDELRQNLTTVSDAAARQDIEASLDTVAAQLRRTSPSRAVLTESLRSLRSVSEQIGAGLLVAKLLQLAQGLGLV